MSCCHFMLSCHVVMSCHDDIEAWAGNLQAVGLGPGSGAGECLLVQGGPCMTLVIQRFSLKLFKSSQNPCLDLSEIKFRKRAVGLTTLSGWWLIGHRTDPPLLEWLALAEHLNKPRDGPALCSESEGFITVPSLRAFRGFSGPRF